MDLISQGLLVDINSVNLFSPQRGVPSGYMLSMYICVVLHAMGPDNFGQGG